MRAPLSRLGRAAPAETAFETALARTGRGSAALTPSTADRGADQGLHLVAPPNGAVLAAGAPITFAWDNEWYNTGADGQIAILIATDPSFTTLAFSAAAPCPASSAPSCPPGIVVDPLPAGTYYWGVGVKFGDNTVHTSEVWSFTVGGTATPPPGGGSSFADAAGDANGAPDITGVSVSNDASGQITIQVTVPGETDLAADEAVVIGLDTDQNLATGAPNSDGADYALVIDGSTHTYGLGQWDGSAFSSVSSPTSSLHFSNGPVLSINRSDLGGGALTGFNFWVATQKGTDPNSPYDVAPDSGTWNYKLVGVTSAPTPATPAPVAKKATVASIRLRTLPAKPVAGGLFHVLVPSIRLSTGQYVRPQRARCSAILAGRALRGTGAGGCTYRIPATAGGRFLAVKVTVAYQGATRTKTFGFPVRRP